MNVVQIFRRWPAALSWPTVGVLVLAAFALACEGDTPGAGGTTQMCNLLESQPPRHLPGPGKGEVVATVGAYCDPAPATHRLTVWLERESGDGKTFFQVGGGARYDDIPPAQGKPYAVSVQCTEGLWRVRAKAEGTDRDGRSFTFVLPVKESTIASVRCPLQ